MTADISKLLLVSDLDQTLLNSKHSISRENLDAVKKFESLGGRFTIATGRSTVSALQFAKELDLQYPAVLFNGGSVHNFHTGETLWQTKLPPHSYQYVLDALKQFPAVGAEFLTRDEIHVLRYNDIVHLHLDHESLAYKNCTFDTIPTDSIKVLFAVPDELMDEFKTHMLALPYEGIYFVQTTSFYLEMLVEGTSKATGLRRLSDEMDIPMENIIAIGDYDNDREMIEEAGMGVAVANAPEEIKRIANYVACSNDEHAIADVVNRLIHSSF